MNTSVDLKSIHPHGGDRRSAFEELSFQLFARHCPARGAVVRRHGAGGDAGLEGVVVDGGNRALVGLQAKFFDDKLASTQWRDLDESIQTALNDNATDGTLQEIIISIPRNLTQSQFGKWTSLRNDWAERAMRLSYPHPVDFTLWDESGLRGRLLVPENRGLLLHFFEFPNFDSTHCRQRTNSTVSGLGDRYQPALHTVTEAEDKLHVFLRGERCRQQFLEQARENLRWRGWTPKSATELPEALRGAFSEADSAWQHALPLFGDGVSLPPSFLELSLALAQTAEALMPLMEGLSALIPPRESRSEHDYQSPQSRGPHTEMLSRFDRWEWNLRSLAGYLKENAVADQPCLLLSGEPGTGKTHVLAEVCSRYSEQGGIVLFVEGAKFSTDEPPWTQFMRWAGFSGGSAHDLIETLSAMAAVTSLPVLICIDALNETPNRSLWRNELLDFAAELPPVAHVKLLVSCRSDYLEQTLPTLLRDQRAPGWAFAEHQGLGIEVFEAFPKFVAAYDVKWNGLPPLVQEFRNPLFLRIFCEAYAGRTPESGSYSLGCILRHYAQRKAELLGHRIDCDPSRVLEALRGIAEHIRAAHALQIPERDACAVCELHHVPTETSRSLYRALLSEGILAEFPDSPDALGPRNLVRFTYERVWDYFISLSVLPTSKPLSSELTANLRDARWRWDNSGLVSLLNVRFPEEGHGEVCDLIAPDGKPDFDVLEQFLESLPWRTHRSVTPRTLEIFEIATDGNTIERALDHLVPLAPNPMHPWNADWLHTRLAALPLAERDRTWTFWVNQQLFRFYDDSPLRELLAWAERVRLEMVADEHRFLLATILAWCASTTVVEGRKRLSSAITRLLAGRTDLAARLVGRFLPIDDPYVREWVLLAAAGAAQHASVGDDHLRELARVVHAGIFAAKAVEPHLLIRHYAAEICQQAEAKSVLPVGIEPATFRPPFHSKWPRILSEKKCDAKKKIADRAYTFFQSVVPDCDGAYYGDWGRYVMQGRVEHFLPQKLSEPIEPVRQGFRQRFDARIARRYVIQRVFEIGWDPQRPDNLPEIGYEGRGGSKVERLSKKYQWIALYEFLGLLSDHYHFHDYDDRETTFHSARQLIGCGLLDPFVTEPPPEPAKSSWDFVRPPAPWWRGYIDLLPRPLSASQQRETAEGLAIVHPVKLLALNDGQNDWFTLSAFHEWNEPKPVWTNGMSSPYVNIEVAIQSYLVGFPTASGLLNELSERGFDNHSRLWLEEPEFGQPLATLRNFPLDHHDLRHRCELDEQYSTASWLSGACSTTCRCAPDEEQRRARNGSMPSPQLAEIGNLHWLGNSFDFAPPGEIMPVVSHVGEGFHGACIVQSKSLLNWLQRSDKCLVWRFYIQKYLHNNLHGQNHSRAYWGTFILQPDGKIRDFGGATCAFPHGPGPQEPLPWARIHHPNGRDSR